MRIFLFAALILPIMGIAPVFAQTTAPAARPSKLNNQFVPTYANGTPIVAPTPTPEPPKAPNPWRLSYYVEYQGPRLDNLDLQLTQYPHSAPEYAEIDHSIKAGYAISKYVTIGTQFRPALSTFNETGWFWYDQRVYAQWNHMVETKDLDLSGKLTVEVPTTDASRNAGKIVAFIVEGYAEFKTPLRNWSFSCDFYAKAVEFNDPVSNGGSTDLIFAVGPYITLYMIPNVQLLVEGWFDAVHNYNAALYDYQSGGNDYFDIGPLFTINSHINTNVALRFFTDEINFKAAAIYANLGVAL